MQRLVCFAAAAVVLCGLSATAQTVRYIDGVFVAPRGGAPIELIAYAEARSTGVLQMQRGTLEDAPLIHEVVSVLTSIPHWRPRAVSVTTEKIFRDEQAEQRTLSFAVNQLNVYALGVRIVDLEKRTTIDRLLRAVDASANNPGYAFIHMESSGYIRYYPMRLSPDER
jgi:hypothetical protein